MQRRYRLAHFSLASVVVLVLILLMVWVDAQAQIAFVSHRDGNAEIYLMDVNGGNQRNLTNNRHNDFQPAWSPDGKRIVFVSNRDGHFIGNRPVSEVYVMDANGKNQQRLTNNPNDDLSPSWSPDSKRITFVSRRVDGDKHRHREIYVMDANGKNQQRLTNNPNDDLNPSWSPDGKRIVFSSVRDGHFIGKVRITDEVYVMDTDGKNQQRITENRKNDWDLVWSPDGERIAFSSDRKGDLQNFEIYVMDADGKNQQRITENHVDDRSPSWSPDGKHIVFCSDRDGNAEIYVMDADGKNQQRITNNSHADLSPAWFCPAFAVAPARTGKP